MPLNANAYKEATATADSTIPNLYDEVAEQYLYEREVLRPFGVDKSGMLLGKPGKSITVYKDTAFSVNQLSEGVDTPVTALDWDNVSLSVNWYGDAKQISKEALSYSFDFVWEDLRRQAAEALGENRDTVIMTELLTTTESAIYPRNSSNVAYTSSTIAADAELSYEQLAEVRAEMRKDKRSMLTVIVAPDQEKSLLNDNKFISADYSERGAAGTGVLGRMLGATFYAHNAVQSATENSQTVYQAIALGERPFLYAQKVSPVFEFDEETKRSRSITFHYYEAFGVANLHDESIRIVKSV